MPFHSPRNFCPGGFSCFRPGCNARLSSVICRLSSVVCRLSSAVCQPCPVDPSIRRSVRPFRAFAVLSAVSCRLRLSVACSVLPVRFAAYTSVVSRPPVPCAARDFLVRNTLDAMPLWPNNIFFSLFKLSDG